MKNTPLYCSVSETGDCTYNHVLMRAVVLIKVVLVSLTLGPEPLGYKTDFYGFLEYFHSWNSSVSV